MRLEEDELQWQLLREESVAVGTILSFSVFSIADDATDARLATGGILALCVSLRCAAQ